MYNNKDKTFFIWTNEEDHLRLISKQEGGNLAELFELLVNASNKIEQMVEFAYHQKLGYLSPDPANLGTGLLASVYVQLPTLGENLKELRLIADNKNVKFKEAQE